ncbi:hypothetical protein [Riemerella anatipestifer]|uniref:hypothetical protein n=1 Tax=Riemerella anatipestifer TaxID=34085 RepID=UPI00129E16A3|nr:hypothetical protein [Riemerella anatipestifer]MRM84342.1 hypothetical protein [Riemerella anatipestifer]
MKFIIYLIPIFLFFFKCEDDSKSKDNSTNLSIGQNNELDVPLGIGILQVNTEYPIPLYRNINDRVPFDTIKFNIDKTGVTKFITKIDLKPYVIYEGDSYQTGERNISVGLVRFPPELKFRVVDSTKTTFTVITNEKSNEEFVIKRDAKSVYYKAEEEYYDNNCINCPNSIYNPRWYIFETWERYLKRVEFINKENLKIYDKPNGKIIFEEKNDKLLPFNVIEVNGDWIKLKKGFGREFNFEKNIDYEGWTQWKDGNKILIEITEHTYE